LDDGGAKPVKETAMPMTDGWRRARSVVRVVIGAALLGAGLLACAGEPWAVVGDYFYMHKLAETIKAHRGVQWEVGKK
jgi:hypothetical protein